MERLGTRGMVEHGQERQRREKAKRTMVESGSADFTVFTDGSAEEGNKNGGGRELLSRGSLDNPDVVDVLKKPAGVI